MKRPARHFDRGFRSALRSSLPAVVLLAACSGGLTPSTPGTGGTTGIGGTGIGGTTGVGGTTGIGGTGGGGATGIGGSGGTAPLPECPVNTPTFGVCFTSDADAGSTTLDVHTSGAATIEAVGSGAVSCTRTIGISGISEWWLQARAGDNRLWTIGVWGLGGSTPLVSEGDVVTLDADWRVGYPVPGITESSGRLQVADAAGTPLLWAGRTHSDSAIPTAPTWISFRAGDYVCGSPGPIAGICDQRGRNVIATVNGNSITLPPYGTGSLGGYSLQVTMFGVQCTDFIPPFQAGAAKVSPTTTP